MFRTTANAALAGVLVCASPALAAEGARPDKVSFYFAAHQDDWQLFMNPSAFRDVIGGAAKTVFIHVTAGDAGLGTGTGQRRHPLYLARDNGAEQAVRFMADADAEPGSSTGSTMPFNGHPIYRVGYRNTVSYFLRARDKGGVAFAPQGGRHGIRDRGAYAAATEVLDEKSGAQPHCILAHDRDLLRRDTQFGRETVE